MQNSAAEPASPNRFTTQRKLQRKTTGNELHKGKTLMGHHENKQKAVSWTTKATAARGAFKDYEQGSNRSYTSGGDLHDSGLKGSLMKFMKPRRSWAAMKIGKKQFHVQENQQLLLKNTSKVVTLEDWILSSPGLSTSTSGGDLHVSKQTSNRVHPSFDGEHEDFEPNSKASFPVETPREINKSEKGQLENTSLCTNKSGKMKKIVSFRNPVVADAFLLRSPQTNS